MHIHTLRKRTSNMRDFQQLTAYSSITIKISKATIMQHALQCIKSEKAHFIFIKDFGD